MIHKKTDVLTTALIAWLALALAVPAPPAQDTLARAKDFYSAAAYDEALDILAKLHAAGRPAEATEVALYQMLCLVALGRSDDAKGAMEEIVRADPLYRLSEASASPHVRTLFDQVRRPLLPEIVKQTYAQGKDAFDRKDLRAATAAFDRVIALLADPDLIKVDGMADVRTLAVGFRDLSRIPDAPPAAPAPAAVVPPPAPKPESKTKDTSTPQVFGPSDVGVTPPAVISQPMPPWNPVTPGDAAQEFQGALELVIDETGRVSSVTLIKSVHKLYDASLIEAARRWKFAPATVNGIAVRYRYVMGIQLRRVGV